ncbi:MAG: hypothetical protein LBK73_12320 [Treponema sp.]|nr:hypothetical protein [Treponema sp.]
MPKPTQACPTRVPPHQYAEKEREKRKSGSPHEKRLISKSNRRAGRRARLRLVIEKKVTLGRRFPSVRKGSGDYGLPQREDRLVDIAPQPNRIVQPAEPGEFSLRLR